MIRSHHRTCLLLSVALLLAAVAPAPAAPDAANKTPAAKPAKPAKVSRWEKHIQRFEARDKKDPPPTGAILFLGSSSIVGWDTEKYFPRHVTINRGFGGSQISDSVEFADRILIPYAPRLVVFYAGDNDIAAGKSPETVLADYQTLVKNVHAKLPKTQFLFVPIKPSLRRWKMWPRMKKANALVEAFSKTDKRLGYVDTAAATLGPDGTPRKDVFKKDGLHLNPTGYKLWSDLVRPRLGPPDRNRTTPKPKTKGGHK